MDARGDCIRTSAPCRTHNPTAQTDRPPISSSFFRNLRSPMGSSAILTTSCNRGNKKKIQKTKHALSRIPTINSRHPRKKKKYRKTLFSRNSLDLHRSRSSYARHVFISNEESGGRTERDTTPREVAPSPHPEHYAGPRASLRRWKWLPYGAPRQRQPPHQERWSESCDQKKETFKVI